MNPKEETTKEPIPKGLYCYDESGVCLYWSLKADLPNQENGYCAYLGKSDWDLNEEGGAVETWQGGKRMADTPPHEAKMSLLWDQVKECDVNTDEP